MTEVGTLITANAGCGKTFTLANRVLGWLVLHHRITGSAGARDVLAATFTRKAAGEIQQRILRHLAHGSLDSSRLQEYASSIGLSSPPTQSEMASVLKDVARDIDRLQINTLDGIFHELARALPEVVALPQGWTIGDQPALEALQREAIDVWLRGCDPKTLSEFVATAEGEVLKGSMHGVVTRTIWGDGRGGGLLELWRRGNISREVTGHDPWDWFEQLHDQHIAPMAKRATQADLDEALSKLLEAPLPTTNAGTPKKRWTHARDRVANVAREGRWTELLLDSLVQAVVQGQPFDRAVATPAISQALTPLVGHACQHLVDQLRLRLGIWRNLLDELGAASDAQQQAAGLFGFSDIAARLAGCEVLSPQGMEEIAWRLDSKIRDLALDEFQDTSVEQARVLLPLIDELFAGAGSHEVPRHMLVVADPKQSIYGWRGGTPELIDWLRMKGGDQLNESTLATSYRSVPIIMDFVNACFCDVGTNAALLAEGDRRPVLDHQLMSDCGLNPTHVGNAVEAVMAGWSCPEHVSADVLGQAPGVVQAFVARPEDAAERAADIVESRIAYGGTIGVLCPTNTTLSEAAEAIRARGIAVSEEGRSGLDDIVAAARMLDLFTLADHPGHTMAAYAVSHSPFGPHIGLNPLERCGDRLGDCEKASRNIRNRVADIGLARMLASLVDAVSQDLSSREDAALRRMVLLASEWGQDRPRRLLDFAAHVRQVGLAEATEDRVRVMTIHASKGLEFDEVVLPFLEKKMVQESSEACQGWASDALGTISAIAPGISSKARVHAPLLNAIFEQSFARGLADRLSLLYVAITRARHGLHLVFAPIGKRNTVDAKLAPSTFVRAAIPDIESALEDVDPDRTNCIWRAEGASEVKAATPSPSPAYECEPVQLISQPAHQLTAPSSHGDMPMRERCRLQPGRARRDGVILHELFRTVCWLDDGPPSEDDLEQAFAQAAIQLGRPVGSDLRAALRSRFEQALAGPMRAMLCRDAHQHWSASTLEVHPEQPILVGIDDQIIRGRIDRLVLGCDENGTVTHASILDFKTGHAPSQADQEAAMEWYQPQLDRYAEAISAIYSIPIDAIETGLLFVE